jgi:hypothetical protein
MRALRRLARPAVATAAAVLVLSGCGDDDDGGDDFDLGAFCDQAQEFATTLQTVDPSAPETIGDTLQDASEAFDAAEPPDEIADDWATLGDALREWADTVNSVDITTPEGAQEVSAATQEFQAVFTGPAGTAVDEYGSENCT